VQRPVSFAQTAIIFSTFKYQAQAAAPIYNMKLKGREGYLETTGRFRSNFVGLLISNVPLSKIRRYSFGHKIKRPLHTSVTSCLSSGNVIRSLTCSLLHLKFSAFSTFEISTISDIAYIFSSIILGVVFHITRACIFPRISMKVIGSRCCGFHQ
jgi:hypothetical protein